MTLRRGFKTEAEKKATELRRGVGLAAHDSLHARQIAELSNVTVVEADELVPLSDLEELERIQAFAFSAATFKFDERHVIVVNPLHSAQRQNSDIAHEISHIILGHDLSEVRELAPGTSFRTCKPQEEEEATTYGGTLLLPRPLLLSAARRRAGIETIAAENNVTIEMARFRYNTTGVERQAAASGARASRAR